MMKMVIDLLLFIEKLMTNSKESCVKAKKYRSNDEKKEG
jgi:hypothetical protein